MTDDPTADEAAPRNRGRFTKGSARASAAGKKRAYDDDGNIRPEFKDQQRKGGRNRKNAPDFHAHQSAAGKKGYQVTLQRYGYEFIVSKIGISLRRRLTRPERWTLQILTGAGLIEGQDFFCQHPVCLDHVTKRWVIVDFLIRGHHEGDSWVVIEPGDPLFHGQPGDTIDESDRQAYDEARADAIVEAKGWSYIDFNARWIDDPVLERRARRYIRWAVGRAGYGHSVCELII